MGQCLYYECDICTKSEKGELTRTPPDDWFEFDYQYSAVGEKHIKNLHYLVCSFRCYIIMLDKCYDQAVMNAHGSVLIAGMSKNIVRGLLENINTDKLKLKLGIQPEHKEQKFLVRQSETMGEEEELVLNRVVRQPTYVETPVFSNKIIDYKVESISKLDWLEDFFEVFNDSKLTGAAKKKFDRDNLTTYDTLFDSEFRNKPYIRYLDHYIIFIYEHQIDNIENLKTSNSYAA